MRVQGSGFRVVGSAVCAALGLALLAGCGPATPKQEFEAGLALLKKGIGQIFKDGCGKCDQKDFSDQVFLDQHTV